MGNLAVGGAGKSPMTEYIIRLLKADYKIATLSRGYRRTSKGFLLVNETSTVEQAGDEPLQFKRKFPEITVAVCESRVAGIEALKDNHDLVILDDAYQHRAAKPGFSLLLFDYNQLFKWQWYLPTGNLRESLAGRARADVIVITKTPAELKNEEKEKIIKRIKPLPEQEIFFSYVDYGNLEPAEAKESRSLTSLRAGTTVFLLTGIANADPLVKELKKYTSEVRHHEYPDHHQFTRKNILKLVQAFKEDAGNDKIIVTTEKDYQRLRFAGGFELLEGLPVYYLPVVSKLHPPSQKLDNLIKTYVAKHLHNY